MEGVNQLHQNPYNGHKSAWGLHKKGETQKTQLGKLLSIYLSHLQDSETIVYIFHTNPKILKVTQQYRHSFHLPSTIYYLETVKHYF